MKISQYADDTSSFVCSDASACESTKEPEEIA